MFMLPFQVLMLWLRGLLSVGLLVAGPYLLYRWFERSHVERPVATQPATQGAAPRVERVFEPHLGADTTTAFLLAGAVATLWAIPKGPLVSRRMLRRRGDNEPRQTRGGEVQRLAMPGGGELQVEVYGPADAPLALIRGRRRKRFLVRADRSVDLQAFMATWRARAKPPASVRVTIDVDPYSFL